MKSVRVLSAAALSIAAIAIATPQAQASPVVIRVSAGQSIQAAVNAAAPGDTIKIGAGTFHEQVVLTSDDLTVIGAGTVVTPPAGSGVILSAGSTVSGVTVRGGLNGFDFSEPNVTLTNDHAVDNTDFGFIGEGPGTPETNARLAADSATGNRVGFQVGFTTLASDTASGNDAGFEIANTFGVTMVSSTAQNNCMGLLVYDSGLDDPGLPITITNSEIVSNTRSCPHSEFAVPLQDAIGAAIIDSFNVTFTNNVVSGNGPAHGAGHLFSGGLTLQLLEDAAGNVVSHNAFATNRPYDISTNNTEPGVFDIFANACHIGVPAALCP